MGKPGGRVSGSERVNATLSGSGRVDDIQGILKVALAECGAIARSEYEISKAVAVSVDLICVRLIKALRGKSVAFDGRRAGRSQLETSVSRICAQLENE